MRRATRCNPTSIFAGLRRHRCWACRPGARCIRTACASMSLFGDTVNWDLIPLSAVNAIQLLAGANPVFGPNTLGGALSLRMKNGFDNEGTGAEVYGGSFARRGASIEHGGNDARWGYYGNVDYFEE